MKRTYTVNFVCGTALIVAPFIHNLLTVAMVTYLIAHQQARVVHLGGSLSDSYQYWCFFIGACVLISGVVGQSKNRGELPAPVMHSPAPAAS